MGSSMVKEKKKVELLIFLFSLIFLIGLAFCYCNYSLEKSVLTKQTNITIDDVAISSNETSQECTSVTYSDNVKLAGNNVEVKSTNVVSKDVIFIDQKCNNFVYIGKKQDFVKSLNNLSGALCGINEDAMMVDGAIQTVPGTYKITIRLKNGYTWEDGSTDDYDFPEPFIIQKKDLDLSNVSIANDIYTFDGKEKRARIINEDVLSQEGIINYYWENNVSGGIFPGVYNVKLIIDVDERFYNSVSPISGSVSINPTKLSIDDENLVLKVEVNALSGNFSLGNSLKVENIEPEKSKLFQQSALYNSYVKENESLAFSYDISLVNSDEEVSLTFPVNIKMLVPNEVKGKDFRILHIHNDDITLVDELDYEIDGNYISLNVDSLSEFAFIVQNEGILNNSWVIILVSIIGAVCLVLFVLYYSSFALWKRNGALLIPALEKRYRKTNIKLAKTNLNDIELIEQIPKVKEEKETATTNIKENKISKEDVFNKKPRKKRSTPRKKTTRTRKSPSSTRANNKNKTTKTK